jgi:soluble cytochrome b562
MGKGGGGPTQTTSTVQNTNVPEYARPYVETMLGATQEQLFQGSRGPSTTDPSTGETVQGNFNITGFKPYQAYGGTYDSQGKQTSYDPGKAISGFQPMQEAAQRGIAGMQVPGQFRQGMDITGAGVRGAFGTAGQAAMAGQQYAQQATNPYATQAYMSPYMQNVVDVQNREAMRNAQIAGTQQQGEVTRAGAFGGSRDAIMRAERERNLSTLMNQNQAQGLQSAYQQAQQAQQFGANLGLQGLQGAQQGYNAAMQGGQQLAGLGQQQLATQQGIYNLQNQFGAQQQALEQQKINQAMQDYANAQQYPLMQLGTMSNMLRGLPMQASSTQQYQAAPNQLSQAIGTIGSGASIYNAFNPSGRPPGQAAGGEVKGYAKGGIMSYDMGGEVEAQLENMDEKGLEAQAKESSSPSIRRMAERILRERKMSEQGARASAMGVQYQAPQPQMPGMRSGGIIAFQTGNEVKEEEYRSDPFGAMTQEERDARKNIDGLTLAEERAKQQRPYSGPSSEAGEGDAVGIMSATPPPAAAPVSKANAAMQRAGNIPDFMKAEYADTEKRMNAPLSTFMAERKAAMQEAGVADVSEGQRKQREELMAEKANMADEKERQKHLRLAEFFASWGSTPGPTLVAGMNALKQSVPGIISDEKEQKKARREIDKSIADLDNATRLEKRGEVDAAMALKLKAAEDMKALNIKFIDYQSRRESDASSSAASKYSADMQFRSEQLRSQTLALDRAARRDTDKDTKIFGQWQAASKTEADVLGRIQREENDKQHMADLSAVKLGKQTGMDEDNKFDETKVPPAVLSAMKEAQARIETREKNWKQRIKTAAENTDIAYNRIAIRPEVAARDYTRPTGEPQAGASTRPALTDPSLQRQ